MTESMFVDKFYEMDPMFEDILPDGTYLREGMVVLFENHLMRADPSRTENPYEIDRAREVNRWATVSHVNIKKRYEHDEMGRIVSESSGLVSFIATYGDGTKRKRNYDVSYAWIVKLDSVPKE